MPAAPFSNPLYFLSSGGTAANVSSKGSTCMLTDVLEFFFVARPQSGRKEGEETKRVMYFFPASTPTVKQTDITGFAEAVVNFTENFSNKGRREDEFRVVNTAKSLQVFIVVEKSEFIIGVSLNKCDARSAEYPLFAPAVRSFLRHAHRMFTLFFGPLSHRFAKSEDKFKDRLQYFFTRFLALHKLHQMPLLDVFSGVDFLPLQNTVYLQVDTLMSEVMEEFPSVEKVLFLQQDKLLYYTCCRVDLPSLFYYLTNNVLPISLRTELEPTAVNRRSSGHFVTGPYDISSDAPIGENDRCPHIHLTFSGEGDAAPHQMLVYRCLSATVCLIVGGGSPITRRLMRNLDAFLSPHLAPLASAIADSCSSGCLRPTDYHYIYFNPATLSLRTSFEPAGPAPSGAAPSPLPPVPVTVHALACDSYAQLMSEDEEFGESFLKTDMDWWITIKKVNGRVLVLLLPPSNDCSLADVQLKTHHIVKSHFESLFLE